MERIACQYSGGDIDRAGKVLVCRDSDDLKLNAAQDVMSSWRAGHGYPLEVAHHALRKSAHAINPKAITAQRLKRLPSIVAKLLKKPTMALSRMHDIGGCRAILSTMGEVNSLLAPSGNVELGLFSDLKKYDYIASPKASGYRSVHFVWRYRSKGIANEPWDGMRVEIQIRSALQHTWATAVEMASTYRNEDLKGGVGDTKWFFSLMGSAMAQLESCPSVPGTPEKRKELIRELSALSEELKVCSLMRTWSEITALRDSQTLGENSLRDARLFLVTLRETDRHWFLDVRPFSSEDKNNASSEYLKAEKESAGKQNVQVALLSVESIDDLRDAYPNYYGDTGEFVKVLEQILLTRSHSISSGHRQQSRRG